MLVAAIAVNIRNNKTIVVKTIKATANKILKTAIEAVATKGRSIIADYIELLIKKIELVMQEY